MLLRFSKLSLGTRKEADETRDITDDVNETDFIPYAYHYDPDTLLTKNGELLQIIRITAGASGVDYESPEPDMPTLRDSIRQAIGKAEPSERYAFWFHTLRRKIPIQHTPQFPERFATDLHKAWQAKHHWHHGYTNEIYISVLRQGQSAEMFDLKQMAKTMLPSTNRRYREGYLEEIKAELDATVGRLLKELSPYSNAKRLGMIERNDNQSTATLYSEPLELLHYLVNLQAAPMPVADADAARQLSTHELTFGFDAMESRGKEGKRRFAGLLTLKGAMELSTEVLDKCLQMPEEMIITQSFNYLPKKQALEKLNEMREVALASLDPLLPRVSGLEAMFNSDRGLSTDFGEQHNSIAIICDHYKGLDATIGGVQEALGKLGLIGVREEIMLEDCFWAQLPGNFVFLRRKIPIASNRMGGLMRLNHFPSGFSIDTPWKAPVAILPTTLGTPYFFNFHIGNAGHTAIFDFNSFADDRGTSLLNFLLASSRQFGGRLVVLDRNHSARPLIRALGGHYYHLLGRPEADLKSCPLNPLQLPDTPRNRAFLAAWLGHCVTTTPANEEAVREQMKGVLDELFALPQEQRTLENAVQRIAARDATLAAALRNPALQALFGSTADGLDPTQPVWAMELLEVMSHRELIMPLFSYLLHRIVSTLDGQPTIIVLHEAWDVLDNEFFLPRLGSLMDMLSEHNAMMVFTTRHIEDYRESHLTRLLVERVPTRLFIPDDVATDYFPGTLKLTEREAKRLLRMERQKGHFLLKHGPEVVECVMPQEGLEAFSRMLAGDAKGLRLMQIQQR